MNLAPVILFCYNRPWHVEQTLIALSKNELSDRSVLYIYCDGPKENATDEQINNIKQTRKVVRKEQWCKEVHIIEAEQNKGLANSIIEGVTEIINKYGNVIVVEDDIVTSRYFLTYMNKSLELYENNKGVFSIGAFNFPSKLVEIPRDYKWDNYASLRVCSWGWASWKDRWNKIEWDIDNIIKSLSDNYLIVAFNRGGDDLYPMLKDHQKGRVNSWAIRFGYAHFYNHSVCMCPISSYVDNLGLDGTGEHCGNLNDKYKNDLTLSKKDPRLLEMIYEDKRIINAFYNTFTYAKRPLWQKVVNFIARKCRLKQPYIIKKKVYA